MALTRLLVGLFILCLALAPAAPAKVLYYENNFQPDSEPDGFRGIKWLTEVAKVDPFNTMDVIGIIGDSVFYKRKKEDMHVGLAEVQDIIYEFWKGKFSSVMVRTQGLPDYLRLRDYCFAMYGPGKRSETYQRLDVQDFTWNGFITRMFLTYSDFDRHGDLSLYSIKVLNQKRSYDRFIYYTDIMEQLKQWQRTGPR